MHTRLAIEGKGGATMRSGGPYDGWWNGGIRNTATFHNTIAMLTEIIGSPTPMRIPLVLARQIPSGDLALPIAPQEWHFRQSIDYSIVARPRGARLRVAHAREPALQHLQDGQALHRAREPRHVDGESAARRGGDRRRRPRRPGRGGARGGRSGRRRCEGQDRRLGGDARAGLRDPRGFIIPSDQPDFPDGDEVRQRAARDRHHGEARDARLRRRRQALSRRDRTSCTPRRRSGRT